MNATNDDTLAELEAKLSSEIAALEQKRADLEAVRRTRALLGEKALRVVSNAALTTIETGNGVVTPSKNSSETPRSGEVNDAVIAAARKMVGTFSIKDIDLKLKSQGMNYVRSSIRAALGRMESRHEILVAKAGRGRRPTRYKSPETQPQ